MIFYKEVHKYNGNYYSRYDNGFMYKIGEIVKSTDDDYIYGTDTIENVLKYNYCQFDMAILELETIGKHYINGYVVTTKKAKVLREVDRSEYDNTSTEAVSDDKGDTLLFDLLKKTRDSILSEMRYEF